MGRGKITDDFSDSFGRGLGGNRWHDATVPFGDHDKALSHLGDSVEACVVEPEADAVACLSKSAQDFFEGSAALLSFVEGGEVGAALFVRSMVQGGTEESANVFDEDDAWIEFNCELDVVKEDISSIVVESLATTGGRECLTWGATNNSIESDMAEVEVSLELGS